LEHVDYDIQGCEYSGQRYISTVNFRFFTSYTGVFYGGTGGGPLTRQLFLCNEALLLKVVAVPFDKFLG
jgi:hypothetical protein